MRARIYMLCCTLAAAVGAAAAPANRPSTRPATTRSAVDEQVGLIRAWYADDYAKKSRHDTLAQLLLDKGRTESVNADRRVAFLRESEALAVECVDAAVALGAAGELSSGEAPIAALRERCEVLSRLAGNVVGADRARVFVDGAMALADDAVGKEEFSLAQRALGLAEKECGLVEDSGRVARVKARGQEVAGLAKDADVLKAAEATLRDKPHDRAASLLVGRYRCLLRGDWAAGLPLLEQCRDDDYELAAVKEKELRRPGDYVAAARAWWKVAEKEMGSGRRAAQSRAARYYGMGYAAVSAEERPGLDARVLGMFPAVGGVRCYLDDPAAQAVLLGPDRVATAAALNFAKFAVRNDKDALKNKNVSCALWVNSAIPPSAGTRERIYYHLRVLCVDESNRPHVIETDKSVLLKLKPNAPLHLQGPSYDDVRRYNRGSQMPRNAHLVVLLDTTPLWEGLWRVPEQSCWWLDDALLVK